MTMPSSITGAAQATQEARDGQLHQAPPAPPPPVMPPAHVAPPSRIADVDPQFSGVDESQQAATAPGSSAEVADGDKIPFKEQVNGYAKLIAGKVFHNEREVEFGKAKLEGEI